METAEQHSRRIARTLETQNTFRRRRAPELVTVRQTSGNYADTDNAIRELYELETGRSSSPRYTSGLPSAQWNYGRGKYRTKAARADVIRASDYGAARIRAELA